MQKQESINLQFNQVLFFIELFILIPTEFFDSVYVISVGMKVLRIVILGWECILLLGRGRIFQEVGRDRFKYYIIGSLLLYAVIQFLVVCIKTTSYFVSACNSLVAILVLLLVLHRQLSENYEAACRTIGIFAFTLILINAATILLFPNGLYTENLHEGIEHLHICYFLGVSNQFSGVILPLFTVFLFFTDLKNGKRYILRWIGMILVLYCVIATGSATGMVLSIALIVLSFFRDVPVLKKIFDIRVLLIVYVIIFFIVVFAANVLGNINAVNSVVSDWLGKNLTFSGRTNIWSSAMPLIREAPFFGHGELVTEYGSGLYVYYNGSYYNAHNEFLQIILKSGFLSLIPFVGAIILSAKKLLDNIKFDKSFRIFQLGIFFTLMYFTFEHCKLYSFITLIMVIAEYSMKTNQELMKKDP